MHTNICIRQCKLRRVFVHSLCIVIMLTEKFTVNIVKGGKINVSRVSGSPFLTSLCGVAVDTCPVHLLVMQS